MKHPLKPTANAGEISQILDGTEIPYAYKLSYVLNFYREPSFRQIENLHGLKRSEIVLLIFLAFRGGITAQEICDFTGHLKPNISRAVLALQKRRLICRRTEPNDNRRQLLYLTDEGLATYEAFIPILVSREETMMAALSVTEKRQFMRLLTKLTAHVPSWTGDNDALQQTD